MSSFFIRSQNENNIKKSGKIKRKGRIYPDKKTKSIKHKKRKTFEKSNDEEILSDDEEIVKPKDLVVDSDEDAHITPQEKKVKLAKEYLKEIEEEEKERLQTDEVGNDVILNRLHEDVLNQAGKLRKKVAADILSDFSEKDLNVIKCKEHKLAITCLVVSRDNFIYSGSKDCTVVKWSLETRKKVASIPPKYKCKDNENLHSSPITSLAISYDNKYLASSDDSNIILVWDPKSLTFLFPFKGHTAGITGLAFCRFTQHLYSTSKDRTVKVWSPEERAYIETLFGHQMPITGLDIVSKDRAISSGGTDNSIRLWKLQEESQLIYNYTRSIDGVKRLDDYHFISYGDDGTICLWAITKKKPLHIIKDAHGIDPHCKEPMWITSVACIANSDVFASGSSDGLVKLWKCNENFRAASLLASIPIAGFVNTMMFTSDGEQLVIGVGQEHKLGRWSRIKDAY